MILSFFVSMGASIGAYALSHNVVVGLIAWLVIGSVMLWLELNQEV